MKLSLFMLLISTVLIKTVFVRANPMINANEIEWLDIENWNKTIKLNKRGYDSQIKRISFYKGVDVSSIIALENSGIRYYNYNGQQQDLLKILADNGVNCIRVRIWNTPRTTSGYTYGGGNNDLNVATEIGKRAAKYGLPLFVDFHYSDFWADPGKQTIPKDWKNHNLNQRIFDIYRFTYGCLDWLLQNGALISMVQVGNETNCFMCGETDMSNIAKMMNNGAKAVRDINKNILIALHFTNPEKHDHMLWYASELAKAKVDYDVFATSYYSYWHGTVDSVKSVLGQIAQTYGKKVLMAEYSYPYVSKVVYNNNASYSLVYQGLSGTVFRYPISEDGQSQCIREMYKTMRSIRNGIGCFYWEPAWIAPNVNSDSKRKIIWEKYGSSWATKAAAEYDRGADPNITGGAEWDNQAVFDSNGKPLKSLWYLGHE
ncbi:glycosyl hydrolase 53 [Neocallimastix californiae]|jgi:arabinogalactan endo-1,4-beta-galactosidase|uniref:Arabinogalactan endo-beta-1,4-galactanase n=1 Tax=Neocallimastix californiae TaxID=1754190 RepID=A0A1Y2EGP5_9FUNG|nr:glycosyl hydrolase 53 [Neocallimastix californiae]|eukprot:ORY70749.1 glycosyl hydrolase 53 [Neocallimastix californiae]